MEEDKLNPSEMKGKDIATDGIKSESEEGTTSTIHGKECEIQELGFPQIHQEVKKEEDVSSTEQEQGITSSIAGRGSSSRHQHDNNPNPEEEKEPYFEDMSGNLDAKVQKLKDCIEEKNKLEQELEALQQCLEMEISPDEITEEVTLNTILIVESVKNQVRLIDLKEEEIQALTQEVDAGFNVTFDYYADKAESDDDDNDKKETSDHPSQLAENGASDDSDTLELVGSSTKKISAMSREYDSDTDYSKLADSDFFNKFEDDFDDADTN